MLSSSDVDGRGCAYNLDSLSTELKFGEARGREGLSEVSSAIAFPVSSNKVASHKFDDI